MTLLLVAAPLVAQRTAVRRADALPVIHTTAQVAARGDSLQLPGQYPPLPGDALSYYTAGFATTLCGAAFITGLAPADAAANVGFFTGPLQYRAEVKDTVVDFATHTVRLTLKNGVTRVARMYGSQGCVPLPIGADSVSFTPSVVTPHLPPSATTAWPMGDVIANRPWPREVDSTLVAQAMNEAFASDSAMTLAFVVTYKGRIIGERYAPGISIHTPLESWSMCKSLTGTLVGRLIQQGMYTLEQSAPIPEWKTAGDPRQKIRIMDIMRMSSGLRLRAPQDPGYDPALGYPEHLYLYSGGVNSYQYAATRPQQWLPGTVGRYRNGDPVLASYLVRLAAEKRKVDYHSFPARLLFEKIGMRDVIISTDPYGNLLGQGADLIAARDWARLGNLYLQDGMWNGERLLSASYVKYARTIAPAWLADGRPVYGGGFFWINGDGREPMPRDAYAALGAGGQSMWVVPSKGLVIVRIGKYRGAEAGEAARQAATATLMPRGPELIRTSVALRRAMHSALLCTACARMVNAQAAAPRQTEADAYTRYELLAPGTAKFRIIYEVTATTAGATHYFNPIRQGSVATDESVIDRASGMPLAFEVVGAAAARAGGVRGDSLQTYIRVTLRRPVPSSDGEQRILILKTYQDSLSYFTRGDTIVFTRPLGIKRNAVVLPAGYELVSSSFPAQVLQEADGRIGISFWNATPSEAAVTLRAIPARSLRASMSGVAARLTERAHQDREIVYLLQQPETHAFDLYHDYTESRAGVSNYLNIVRAGSTVSNPRAVNLDTGAPLAHETLRGDAIAKAGISLPDVTPQTEVVAFRFDSIRAGTSMRLRMFETYTDSVRYTVVNDELVWDRSFGRPANAVVLPDGWILTNSSVPATVTTLPNGRVRLDFINPRTDEINVLITARRR